MTDPVKIGDRLALQVAVATLARLTINIGHRMVYPFLPAIARGLNISLQTAGVLMTARAAVGLVAPFFGPASDRWGRRRLMVAGLAIFVGGAAFVVVFPRYPAVALGFVLLGLSKVIFDPSLHAYLADRVPYRRRGRAIAFTELSWGGAILVGAPAMGWIIAQWGWSAPYAALVGMGLIGLIGLLVALPRDARPPGALAPAPSFWLAFRLVLRNRAAVAALAITCLAMAANELLFLIFGTWMESSFGLSVTRVGLTAAVIGLAELLGEIGVGGWVDRLGKRRSVAIGLGFTAAGYVALALNSGDLWAARIWLFALFICFEFMIVATIPLVTELVPAARGTMLALNLASSSLGRAIGALIAPSLWMMGGILWNGLAAGAITLCALGLLLRYIHDP